MSHGARVRRIAVAMGKVVAFLAVTQILLQLVVFMALGALSARYWSQYDGRGLNEPWFLTSSVAFLGVVLFVSLVVLKYVAKRDWTYVRFRGPRSTRLFALGFAGSLAAVVLFVLVATITDVVRLSVSVKPPSQGI